MKYDIKAKPTIYMGHRFRSRLEARWALFFDRVGIEWEYEPESFDTVFGQVTPDFILNISLGVGHLVAETVLLEVKPTRILREAGSKNTLGGLSLRYRNACDSLIQGSGDDIGYLIVCGDPCAALFPQMLRDRGTILGQLRCSAEWSELDNLAFVNVEGRAVLEATYPSDFAREAHYARQYDFMHYMPNAFSR